MTSPISQNPMPMPAFEPEGLICPQCGDDFVPGISECSDCHVALVSPTAAPELVRLDGEAVEVATTAEAAVARGWRDALTAAGVTHRIVVSGNPDPEMSKAYALLVGEADSDWAAALAEVVEERPSLDANAAVRLAHERFAAAPDGAFEIDGTAFDVPDLLPPPEVKRSIEAAQSLATAGMVLSILFACAALAISPWWGVAALIAAAESVRSKRVARARLAAWERDNDARYPHEAKTSG